MTQPLFGFTFRRPSSPIIGPVPAIPGYTAWRDEAYVYVSDMTGKLHLQIPLDMPITLQGAKKPTATKPKLDRAAAYERLMADMPENGTKPAVK